MNLRKLLYIAIVAFASVGVVSCNDDDLNSTSIFPEVNETLDPNSYSFQLDSFLKREYLIPYNLDFKYRLEDVGIDMNYNLVPSDYDKSVDLAVLTKYLWFEVYDKHAGLDFLKSYGPRIIHLIGSPAFNPVNGTIILGLAEGGIKVSLYRVNYMDPTNFLELNEFYFKTMHHEFSHILHQTKTYPTEFQLLSPSWYSSTGWQDRYDPVCNSFGCVTNYASSETREDFAETIANYITKTDEQWDSLIYYAGRNWELTVDEKTGRSTYEDPEEIQDDEGGLADGVDGVAVINQKVQIARTWFRDAWGLDLDSLRAEVQRRQSNINIDSLRNLVYSIEKPQ